jgi:hypothetical protein
MWTVAVVPCMPTQRESPPTRGADRNRNLVDRADPTSEPLLLPTLEDGLTLLDVAGDRSVPAIHSLVIDHLLLHDGPAFWVDAEGHATTTACARLAPSRRLLARIHVARGFTAYQHYGAICALPDRIDEHIRAQASDGHVGRHGTAQPTPSLLVVPAVDAGYRACDTLRGENPQTLLARSLAQLGTYADGYDVPVLVTRTADDEFAAPVERAADHHLTCEQTRLGPRFVGDDFETLVYPVADGEYYQTTLAYWRELLDARAAQVGVTAATPDPGADDADGVGAGVTADGHTDELTASPLADAWSAAGRGSR